MDNQISVHSGIKIPSRKYVPVIPHFTEQEHHTPPPLFPSVISMMTENRKAHKPHYYNKSHLKEKDSLHSYQDISSRVSTEVDPNIQSDENHHKNFWKVW